MRELTVNDWPLAKEFNLPPQSTVLVAGSYEGAVMSLLDDMYICRRVIGYDPQRWACQRALDMIDPRTCEVHPVALSDHAGREMLYEYETDAASFHRSTRADTSVPIVEFADEMRRIDVERLDLLVLNMEGHEFTILPHIIEMDWLDRIDRLAVQFHMGLGNDSNYGILLERLDDYYLRLVDQAPAWIYREASSVLRRAR